jgi:SAM-dependent methyltransferase
MRRVDLLPRLGIEPTVGRRLRVILDDALRTAELRSPDAVWVLDAGCGHKSPLVRFRPRIAHLVGVDVHEPDDALPWVDEFAVVDLCGRTAWTPREPFDLILSNFTLEHFPEPDIALAHFRRWLRPDGMLVVTTVNRWHPFVDAYLRLPDGPRRRLQPVLKASAADAHPLVGACNDPRAVRDALSHAGFVAVRIDTVPNLARAWGRHRATFVLGVAGDLLTRTMPSRRSTILAVALPAPWGDLRRPGEATPRLGRRCSTRSRRASVRRSPAMHGTRGATRTSCSRA